jgi:hypothetical protein
MFARESLLTFMATIFKVAPNMTLSFIFVPQTHRLMILPGRTIHRMSWLVPNYLDLTFYDPVTIDKYSIDVVNDHFERWK